MNRVPPVLMRGDWGLVLLGLAGAALLCVPAGHYRIDLGECPAALPLSGNVMRFGAYLLGVSALTAAWLGLTRAAEQGRLSVRGALGLAALLHLMALASLPYLSDDPLFYAAVGRAMTTYHRAASVPLGQSLHQGDALLAVLPASWRGASSTYAGGFDALCALIARVRADDIAFQLRAFQLVGMLSMLGAAALAGQAAGARGAALVGLAPLGMIEATIGAHNDALLALLVAAFALLQVRGQRVLRWAALASGLWIKASALLLLAFTLAAQVPGWIRSRRRAAVFLGLLFTTALTLWRAAPTIARLAGGGGWLLASPSAPCTRSVECLPRSLLYWVFHAPTAAWVVGLVFRAAALGLLAHTALRARREQLLPWAATFLLFYYLYLHPYSQSWYLLSLLPLLPFTPRRLLPVAQVFCTSALVYYAVDRPFDCDYRPIVIGSTEVLQAVIVIVPPTLVLLRGRRRT